MTRFLKNGYFFFLFFTLSMSAQKKEVNYRDFFGFTNDVLLMDDVEYMCSISPLSDFDGYKTVFGNLSTLKSDPELPFETDKNYKAKWRIFDSSLYLYDIEILEGAENYPDKYKIMENFTSYKFRKMSANYNTDSVKFAAGGMFPSWFSGFIFIKRHPTPSESYCDCRYRCEKFKVLGFLNGKLINEKEIGNMIVKIDSMEIINNPKMYQYSNPYYRISPCTILLEESLSLADDVSFSEDFYGHTIDEIRWGDEKFWLSMSPLSVFENYENIYESNIWSEWFNYAPITMTEKNYVANWVILDNKLYLCDDIYIFKEVIEGIKGDTSLKVVEKLTGKKFREIPSFDKKVIFADWFSGTLFFKRPMKELEYSELYCDYRCEPMHKITLEKGKIISWEKTLYMTYPRPKRKVYNTQ